MIKNEALEKFANKYISYFENEFEPTGKSYYRFFDSIEFPNDCRALGFDMDCGESFIKAYGEPAWNNVQDLKACIDKINDIKIIGSGLFSMWRYFNHWSHNHAGEKEKEWFLVLLCKLKSLTVNI